jgi:hypothetical protein
MKNAFIVAVLGVALTSLFSFTNNRTVLLQDDDEYIQDESFIPDTVPGKKDSMKMKRKTTTVPYDSFGKPKKMDTTKFK